MREFVADIFKERHQLSQLVIMYGGQGPKNYPKTKVFYPLLRRKCEAIPGIQQKSMKNKNNNQNQITLAINQ